MRRPKSGQVRIPSPFDTSASKTERSAVAILMHWMRQIIERENLDLGLPDVDTSGADRKSPDTVIYESRRSQNVLCVIEAKPPYYDVLDYEQLKKPAWDKANNRRATYFATTNFQELIWFRTENVNAQKPIEEQVVDKYHLSELEDLNLIDDTRYRDSIIKELERFLTKLYAVHTGREPEPKQAIDEWLIYLLHDKVKRLARYYAPLIEDQCHKDRAFSTKLGKWFNDQGWSFGWSRQDFDKAARQTAYLLVNKILFYDLLQAKRPEKLDPLQIPQSLTKGAQLKKILQSFFDEIIINIDYETIYTTDFIDNIAFPDQKEVVAEVKELVSILQEYDFSKLGYEIIGGIFQKLIPQEERHNLGQYFTNPDVVDLILCFCLKQENDKVFDPACGAGTFLVRAYQHKKLMNQYLKHEDILETLWGNDIAKFPAHLSTINLAINDLSVDRNYPNIMQEDFFNLLSTAQGFDMPDKWRRVRAKTLGIKEREIEYPRWFDCIVGNPPYTRQEEMAEIAPEDRRYKETTIDKALQDTNGRKLADISRRAGIYVYFFVHGAKFLRNGGRFGFVVSESWLDVDYGKGLQEFLLKNYKIVAIIGSKVERWFEDADINTCIVILEKCSGDNHRKERDENLVRFVYLKKPLRYFIPPAQDIWEKQVARISAIKDKFKKTILAHTDIYEGDDFRIFPKRQKELWEEGYDAEEQKYTGAKWGKYLRAPDIFFKILEKGKDKLVPLKQIAEVRRGFTTGADPWFYVRDITDTANQDELSTMAAQANYKGKISDLRLIQSGDGSKWLVERSFVYPVARNPDDFRNILIKTDEVDNFVISVNEPPANIKKKMVYKYIAHGQRKPYNMGKGRREIPSNTETCSSRTNWYQLPDIAATRLLWEKAFDRYHRHFLANKPILANQRFYPIYPNDTEDTDLMAASLNSPITSLYLEFQRTIMGLGAVEATVDEARQSLVLNPDVVDSPVKERVKKALSRLAGRPVESLFSELGASSPDEVSLDKVKPDRRELDRIIMGEILGLTEEEQLEVYRAVIDLVKSRLEKAKSFGKRKKTKEGIDIDLVVRLTIEKVGEDTLGKFYAEKVLSQPSLETKSLPPAGGDISIKQSLMGWRLYSGKQSIDCASELEARYLKVWLEAWLDSVKTPGDEDYLKVIVPELESLKQKIDDIIAPYLDSIVNLKAKDRILRQLWMEITRGVRGE
jgi:type I restriction-modification system DNA methylase subunit